MSQSFISHISPQRGTPRYTNYIIFQTAITTEEKHFSRSWRSQCISVYRVQVFCSVKINVVDFYCVYWKIAGILDFLVPALLCLQIRNERMESIKMYSWAYLAFWGFATAMAKICVANSWGRRGVVSFH